MDIHCVHCDYMKRGWVICTNRGWCRSCPHDAQSKLTCIGNGLTALGEERGVTSDLFCVAVNIKKFVIQYVTISFKAKIYN